MRIILITLLLFLALPAQAEVHKFLFWHPGEAGTTEQAQPLMDLFAEYLEQQIPGTQWEARYFATVHDGRKYIQKHRPTAGIVSHLMIQRYGRSSGMQPILATRPLPQGKIAELWFLIRGTKCKQDDAQAIVYATEPLTSHNYASHFPEAPHQTIKQTTDLLGTLKKIAQGNCHHAVVGERSWSTIQSIGTTWSKQLAATASTKPHPTPSVVTFPNASNEITQQLSTALLTMDAAKELLEALRLAGFR